MFDDDDMSGWQVQQEEEHQQWLEEQTRTRARTGTSTRLVHEPEPETAQEHAMKIGSMLESKYMKRSDLDEYEGERIVTITKIGKVNVAQDDDPPEMKWAMRFKEFDKPMILNSTNIQLCAKACDSDDTDDWIGKRVTIYDDPNVSFGGKLVGGLRIKKAPKQRQADPMDDEAPRGRVPGEDDDMGEAPRRPRVASDDEPFANPYRGRSAYVV